MTEAISGCAHRIDVQPALFFILFWVSHPIISADQGTNSWWNSTTHHKVTNQKLIFLKILETQPHNKKCVFDLFSLFQDRTSQKKQNVLYLRLLLQKHTLHCQVPIYLFPLQMVWILWQRRSTRTCEPHCRWNSWWIYLRTGKCLKIEISSMTKLCVFLSAFSQRFASFSTVFLVVCFGDKSADLYFLCHHDQLWHLYFAASLLRQMTGQVAKYHPETLLTINPNFVCSRNVRYKNPKSDLKTCPLM